MALVLNFESWWYEGNEKQKLLISLNATTNVLQVRIKGLDPIHIDLSTDPLGYSLEVWDMFVGSQIDILGKPTILKRGDIKSIEWNENKGREFIQIRNRLIEEIRKYNTQHFPQRLLVSYALTVPGGYNLKGILMQIIELKEMLVKFRPSLVRQILGEVFPSYL
jgi:hypothetical protein